MINQIKKNQKEYSAAEREIIEAWYPTYGAITAARALRIKGYIRSAKSVKSFCARKKIRRIGSTKFMPGHIPANKGKKLPEAVCRKIAGTQFKVGHRQNKTYPIGSINEWGGYLYIKVGEPKVWRLYHHYIWEQSHGTIPANHVIVFIDGNPKNVVLENLLLLTKRQHAQRNAARVSDSTRKASRVQAVKTRRSNESSRRRTALVAQYGSLSNALAMGEKL